MLLGAAVISGCSQDPVIVQLEDIVVTSSAFAEGEPIPTEHTCDGPDTPPNLTWSAVPEGTAEIAVLVVDRNADGYVHWMVAGVDPADSSPEGGVQGLNSSGVVGYSGPCPPPADDPHEYVFNVYSLADGSGLSEGFSHEDLQAVLQSANGAGQLVGTFDRR